MAAEGEGEGRRVGELSDNPLLAHLVFVKMEDVMDKLKLLNYEQGFCKKLKFKPFSRYTHQPAPRGARLPLSMSSFL